MEGAVVIAVCRGRAIVAPTKSQDLQSTANPLGTVLQAEAPLGLGDNA